jgi:hypothetical protein
MPQPIPSDKTIILRRGTDTVLQRPKLAAQIGNVCATWAEIEHLIVTIYALLMGDTLPKEPVLGLKAHPVAYQIFDYLISMDARRNLLAALVRSHGVQSEIDALQPLLEEIRKRGNERNEIAHGLWRISDDYPEDLIKAGHGKSLERWQPHDFTQLLVRLEGLRGRLGDFFTLMYGRLSETTPMPPLDDMLPAEDSLPPLLRTPSTDG